MDLARQSLLAVMARVVLWAALLWLLVCAATLPLWPLENRERPLHIDPPFIQASLGPSLFIDPVQESVYKLAIHCPMPERSRLIILGGSGAMGFDPRALQGVTSAEEVISAAVILSHFTQMRQIYADLRGCMSEKDLRRSTFLLIPSMASFFNLSLEYTVYENEKLRSRLFAGPPEQVQPRLPRRWLPLAMELWRPVIMGRLLRKQLEDGADTAGIRLRLLLTGKDHSRPAPTQDRWLAQIAKRLPEDGTDGKAFAPRQSAELDALIADIRAGGSGVLMVEQPTQAYVRERSPAYAPAHQMLVERARKLGVPFYDLSTTGSDEEFFDGLHANDVGAPAWSRRLERLLRDVLLDHPAALAPLAPPHPADMPTRRPAPGALTAAADRRQIHLFAGIDP